MGGQVLVTQKGYGWYAGANVVKAKNFTLHSLVDGIVQWRGPMSRREVSVVPWEYVRTKCVRTNPNTLGPKVYEPWMNNHNRGKRHHILRLRKEWLETDKGKEWLEKKEEKKQKQREIQKKIRLHARARRMSKVPAGGGEVVTAGGDSESEAEA